MPDAKRPGRLFASPGKPDGRRLSVYSILKQRDGEAAREEAPEGHTTSVTRHVATPHRPAPLASSPCSSRSAIG